MSQDGTNDCVDMTGLWALLYELCDGSVLLETSVNSDGSMAKSLGESGRIRRKIPDELVEYASRLLDEGVLRKKVAYSDSIDWFGTVKLFDEGQWTSTDFMCNVNLGGFVGDNVYPVCSAVASWNSKSSDSPIKMRVPMKRCEMFLAPDGAMRMKCRVSMSDFASYMTPERYAKFAAIVRDNRMMPCIVVEVTYFNKSGVDALVAKTLELAVNRQKKGLVFNVDTGNESTAKVEQYLDELQQQYQKAKDSDMNRGDVVQD